MKTCAFVFFSLVQQRMGGWGEIQGLKPFPEHVHTDKDVYISVCAKMNTGCVKNTTKKSINNKKF